LVKPNTLTRFEAVVLPHLAAAYNLARWLTRNDHDAEDLVQEAYLRAFKSFEGFHGGDGRGWILAIVRMLLHFAAAKPPARTCGSLRRGSTYSRGLRPKPEAVLLESANAQLLREALEKLPVEFREILILRELEGMSYREIADLAGIRVGTVMSVWHAVASGFSNS